MYFIMQTALQLYTNNITLLLKLLQEEHTSKAIQYIKIQQEWYVLLY